MEIKMVSVADIIPYENNPRKNADAVKYVKNSIEQFGFKIPMVLDANNVIVCGHTRFLAAKKLGMKEVPCTYADDLTEEKIKAFRLADNKTAEFAEWDIERLSIELQDLEINMADFGFEIDDIDTGESSIGNTSNPSLMERFIAPPLSVLDTRQGYWQERKRAWKDLGIKSEVGRGSTLLGAGLKGLADKYYNRNESLQGTSIFDPVLAEVMYYWFCIENGKIFDPFAGGSVRGIVAEKCGYEYHGIDLRQEQIDANNENAQLIGCSPHWYCDDSQNADKYIEDNSVDMIFSCPPYGDLEKYSDDPRDISNMNYDDFCVAYRNIIRIACNKLKKDRFAVFVVGDIRDKNGYYRSFTDYTKACFKEQGLLLYNDMILLEVVATAALRAARQFNGGRKVVKTHQNVLVFYKGDVRNIKQNYGEIKIDQSVFEDSEE